MKRYILLITKKDYALVPHGWAGFHETYSTVADAEQGFLDSNYLEGEVVDLIRKNVVSTLRGSGTHLSGRINSLRARVDDDNRRDEQYAPRGESRLTTADLRDIRNSMIDRADDPHPLSNESIRRSAIGEDFNRSLQESTERRERIHRETREFFGGPVADGEWSTEDDTSLLAGNLPDTLSPIERRLHRMGSNAQLRLGELGMMLSDPNSYVSFDQIMNDMVRPIKFFIVPQMRVDGCILTHMAAIDTTIKVIRTNHAFGEFKITVKRGLEEREYIGTNED